MDFPDLGADIPPMPVRLTTSVVSVSVLLLDQGQVIQVGFRVGFLLPTVLVQVLAEITFTIEQPHPHQGHLEPGRRLEVITGQNAQSAGKQGQGFVNAELHGKIGHRLALVPGAFTIGLVQYPLFIAFTHLLHVGQVAVVMGQFLEPLLREYGWRKQWDSSRMHPTAAG
jgi:hypothetical protein